MDGIFMDMEGNVQSLQLDRAIKPIMAIPRAPAARRVRTACVGAASALGAAANADRATTAWRCWVSLPAALIVAASLAGCGRWSNPPGATTRAAPLSVPSAPADSTAAPSRAIWPKAGERWVYRSSGKWPTSPRRTFEIVARSVSNGVVTDALSVLEPAAGGTELKRLRADQPEFVSWGSIGFEFSPYFGAYRKLFAPSGVLKGFRTPDLDPFYSHWYSEARTVAVESVVVPAGTFRAYKVQVWSSRSPTSPDRDALGPTGDSMEPTRVRYLIWYAPEVGRYVRMERRVTSAAHSVMDNDLFELVSHTRP